MEIRRYTKAYESSVFDLLVDEGEDWGEYYGPGQTNYVKALESSITYIAWEQNIVCGFIRCREDDGFGVYVYDLLTRKICRGRGIGKRLMERVSQDFLDQPIYIMSDVDPYYDKLGYRKVGSIFKLT